ncbi:growth arrest and DNA damage-inducible protein GADD45 alpha [Crotalus adamanteus]|uniref:Growth arrest and DNA damage-inducible protein GADD45 alpha n=4 Tax=Crotalinae TaxID=8710 RepID=A0AAW1BPD1_CROAD
MQMRRQTIERRKAASGVERRRLGQSAKGRAAQYKERTGAAAEAGDWLAGETGLPVCGKANGEEEPSRTSRRLEAAAEERGRTPDPRDLFQSFSAGTCSCNMTLEDLAGDHQAFGSMEKVGDALEEVLSKALTQRSITVGVYEAAKLLNVDPDNVVLCLLAADEEDNQDVALQIHFTLIQAFCCENDINILRVNNPSRLAELLLLGASGGVEQPADLHCVLVTNPHASQWKDPALSQLICFCRESRYMDQWVPVINLPER